ncbi:MAG: transporter [Mycobacterium sp.]|nr:transporter [Mycobacterium sp.]
MNDQTLIGSLVVAAVIALLIGFFVRRLLTGWRNRMARQAELIGSLPPLPDSVGPVLTGPTRGLYVGSTIAPHWNDKVAAAALGFRAKAVLTRYPEGIMVQRTGIGPIWIPDESIVAVRSERAIAGKALTFEGILAIRWKLPSGTEIDTGFRADDRGEISEWVGSKSGNEEDV